MTQFDLNCDMGEGSPDDHLVIPYINSANIACGYHAGNTELMKMLVDWCLKYNVSIGAHPSFPDRENFGRKDLINVTLKPGDVPALITDQLNILDKICKAAGTRIHHVKPHGALYNRAAWDASVAGFICESIIDFDPTVILYGLSNSLMKPTSDNFGLTFKNEVFADRTYQANGSLTPRSGSDALITTLEDCIRQVAQMVNEGTVRTTSGEIIKVIADTICIHGDGVHAVEFAKGIHTRFLRD